MGMQLQHDSFHPILPGENPESLFSATNVAMHEDKDEIIRELRRQVDILTADNLLLQEQLANTEKSIAMIAHELRGPLSPIITYAQMLSRHLCESGGGEQSQDSAEVPPKLLRRVSIQRATEIIISQGQRLMRLVSDLLDASRLSSERFSLVYKKFDIVTMVKECVEQLRPIAPYHTFSIDVPEMPILGAWDSERLQQALGNLLDNAIKYSYENTAITVRLWTTADFVHVSVHNQGASIPAEEIGMLFRPYGRLPGTSGRYGSGLGLYITRCIIEAHGGKLRLETLPAEAQEPTGTTFSFDLPLQQSA